MHLYIESNQISWLHGSGVKQCSRWLRKVDILPHHLWELCATSELSLPIEQLWLFTHNAHSSSSPKIFARMLKMVQHSWQKQKLSNYQSHWSLIKKSSKHFTHICTIKVRSVPSSPSVQDSETRTGTDQKTRHLALYFLGTWLYCVCCIASCCTTSHSPASHHVISCMVP